VRCIHLWIKRNGAFAPKAWAHDGAAALPLFYEGLLPHHGKANLTSRVKGRNLLHISIWEFCFGLQSLFYIDFNGFMKILILHDPCKQLNILLAM